MGIAFTNATTVAGNICANPNIGQFVWCGFNDDDGPINPITMPSGWTQLHNNYEAGDGGNAAVCYIPSSAGSTLTFQNSQTPSIACCSYMGVDPTTPINASGTPNIVGTGQTGAAWTITVPAITTTVNGCQIVVTILTDYDSPAGTTVTSATLAGYTLRGNVTGGGGSWQTTLVFDQNQATAGTIASTTAALTLSGLQNGGYVCYIDALQPGSAAPFIGKNRSPFDDGIADDPRVQRAAFSFPPVQAARAVLVSPRRPADLAPVDDDRARRFARVPPNVASWLALNSSKRAADTDTEDRAKRTTAALPVAPALAAVLAKPVRFPDESADERMKRAATVPPNVAPWSALSQPRRRGDDASDETAPRKAPGIFVAPATQGSAIAQPRKPAEDAPDDTLQPRRAGGLAGFVQQTIAVIRRKPAEDAPDDTLQPRRAAVPASVAPWLVTAQQRRPIDDASDETALRKAPGIFVAPATQGSAIAQPRKPAEDAPDDTLQPRRAGGLAGFVQQTIAVIRRKPVEDAPDDTLQPRRAVVPASVAPWLVTAQQRRPAEDAPDDTTPRKPAGVFAAAVAQLSALAVPKRKPTEDPPDELATARRPRVQPSVAPWPALAQPKRTPDDLSDDAPARAPRGVFSAAAVLAWQLVAAPRRGVDVDATEEPRIKRATVPANVSAWQALSGPRRAVDTDALDEPRRRAGVFAVVAPVWQALSGPRRAVDTDPLDEPRRRPGVFAAVAPVWQVLSGPRRAVDTDPLDEPRRRAAGLFAQALAPVWRALAGQRRPSEETPQDEERRALRRVIAIFYAPFLGGSADARSIQQSAHVFEIEQTAEAASPLTQSAAAHSIVLR